MLPCTMILGATFGSRWRKIIRPWLAPNETAANTSSCWRRDNTCARTSRVYQGHRDHGIEEPSPERGRNCQGQHEGRKCEDYIGHTHDDFIDTPAEVASKQSQTDTQSAGNRKNNGRTADGDAGAPAISRLS